MKDDTLAPGPVAGIALSSHTKPAFIKASDIPWTPWVMAGTHFKLMDVDPKSGGFALFLKVDPGTEAPIHGHLGAVQGVILEGGFAYEDDAGNEGDYICEHGAAIHQPLSPRGCVMFAVLHGPLVGYNPDGSVAGIVDAKLMFDMAKAAGVADHIDAVFH